jgi:hypothetical protein
VHTRDHWVGDEFDTSVQADHGPNCEAPPTTHLVTRFDQAVFNCKDHIMTAINAESYGAIYLTPAALVDFSTGPATVSLDVSTNRKSGRDWWDLWVTPSNSYLQLPLQSWLPDLHGPPANAIHIVMDFDQDLFKAYVFRNGNEEELTIRAAPYTQFLTPDAARRDNYQLTISNNHIKFGMPGYGQFWADQDIPSLNWNRALVQFGHHSYTPAKATTPSNASANTWHIDNFVVSPAIPFAMSHANRRDVDAGAATVTLDTPSPAGHVSFSALGSNLQVRFDGGAWQPAQQNAQSSGGDEHFRSYWTPIPSGVRTIEFRGDDWWAAGWRVRDITVFGV